MECASVDGREGDDERTENERSPPPPTPRSRPTTRDLARKVEAERRRSRSRGNTPARDGNNGRMEVNKNAKDQEETASERPRRHSRSRSSSFTRERESGLDRKASNGNHREKETRGLSSRLRENHDRKSNGNNDHEKDSHTQDDDSRNNENGLKKRRRVRLRNRNRNSRKRNHRHDRRYKPYTELSWDERQKRDEQETERAAMRRANRPTPYNTTQFLMEDHKVDTPDLSNLHMQCDSSDEIEDEMNGDYLERDFSAVYEEVQSERLEAMSKEQLVSEVLALQRRVTELEEEQKALRPSSAGESDHSSSGQPVDKGLRRRLESLSSLEGEVQRLRSENSRLRKTSSKELVVT